jgi:hypothetical protein|tara:strand:+ start:864 stop:1322 length:459 start_codon:yes stop_codon:yes gene_type:complete
MIHIEANGGLRKERKLAKDVMWFCLEMLMPRMRNLTIELEFTNTLDEGAMGFAFMGEDRKDLIIEIDHKLGRDEGQDKLIETLTHEMVHIWQFATGRLKDTSQGEYKQLWKCKDGKYRNYNKTSYDRQPWETEAYALEGKLAKLYEIMKENG